MLSNCAARQLYVTTARLSYITFDILAGSRSRVPENAPAALRAGDEGDRIKVPSAADYPIARRVFASLLTAHYRRMNN